MKGCESRTKLTEAIRFEHDGLVDAKLAAPAEEVVHVIPSEERFRLGVLPALELEFRHRLLLTNKTDTGKCTNAIRSSDAPIQHVQTRGIDNLAIGKPVPENCTLLSRTTTMTLPVGPFTPPVLPKNRMCRINTYYIQYTMYR